MNLPIEIILNIIKFSDEQTKIKLYRIINKKLINKMKKNV